MIGISVLLVHRLKSKTVLVGGKTNFLTKTKSQGWE